VLPRCDIILSTPPMPVAGAGKTSTFKMITGDETISDGDAWVSGNSVRESMPAVRQSLGYTPQFDALCPLLTGRETLVMYAKVRGIHPGRITAVVDAAIVNLNLSRWADKPSITYSGGNRRKLSVAIALLGNPPLLLLDEPTAGKWGCFGLQVLHTLVPYAFVACGLQDYVSLNSPTISCTLPPLLCTLLFAYHCILFPLLDYSGCCQAWIQQQGGFCGG